MRRRKEDEKTTAVEAASADDDDDAAGASAAGGGGSSKRRNGLERQRRQRRRSDDKRRTRATRRRATQFRRLVVLVVVTTTTVLALTRSLWADAAAFATTSTTRNNSRRSVLLSSSSAAGGGGDNAGSGRRSDRAAPPPLQPVVAVAAGRAAEFDDSFDVDYPADNSVVVGVVGGGDRRRFLRNGVALVSSAAVSASVGADSATATAVTSSTTTTAAVAAAGDSSSSSSMMSWPLGKIAFSLLPLEGTYTDRLTVQQAIVENRIWTHDQLQGVVNVDVPVRQTVVKLSEKSGGGLWVHNPVAPTPELLEMMRRLEERHGPVRHVVLGTVALEHKATFGDFASYFPNATVWVQPGQWSFPLQVPIELLGVRQRGPKLREIPVSDPRTNRLVEPLSVGYRYYANEERGGPVPEWISDFDYEVLGPFRFRSVGAFSETAFYHESTRTLIVTDAVVRASDDPPPVLQRDPKALLYHARDSAFDIVHATDTPENRRRGWRRMVQFGLVFFPSRITVTSSVKEALEDAKRVPPDVKKLGRGAIPGDGSLYPWTWNDGDADSANFRALTRNGRPFCPPILTKLILDREPAATLAWVDRVATRFRDMKRIIPCHLDNDIAVRNSKPFYDAFDPLRTGGGVGTAAEKQRHRPLAEDLALLQRASDTLTELGVVAPSQVDADASAIRRAGRFASTYAAGELL